ncbi:response regulator [Deinococcus knuensis]|uniref:Response regulator n=1 Tax=Deinococcus knuensis TaxID=1837380 RepID=A0ABQ2SA58_9DEIO|nr:response regulator [Deinococcus knuensis]GGS13787.1 response regulator [Deinococcus knuensis]
MPDRLRVLLIDDNTADLLLAEEAFEDHAAHTELITFTTGQDALNWLQDPREPLPDVIMLDWYMPGMTGQEVLNALHADPTLASLPVTVMSGVPIDRPGVHHLTKSVTLDDHLRQITDLVNGWCTHR